MRLGAVIPWDRFDHAFGGFFRPVVRAAKPTRLMAGLHYLKHIHDLSDEETVERWVENPYRQHFRGCEFFQHEPPIDPSTMTRWRKRIGPDGMEEVLKATIEAAVETGTVNPSSLERASVDTTVQPKAIACPTDSRLYLRALQALVRQAKRHGIDLRQSYTRPSKPGGQVARLRKTAPVTYRSHEGAGDGRPNTRDLHQAPHSRPSCRSARWKTCRPWPTRTPRSIRKPRA